MVMAVPEEVRNKIVAQIPTGRLGAPEEIAYAVAFFVPDEAGLDHWRQPRRQWRPVHGLVSAALARRFARHLPATMRPVQAPSLAARGIAPLP